MVLNKLNKLRLKLLSKPLNLSIACASPLINNLVIISHNKQFLELASCHVAQEPVLCWSYVRKLVTELSGGVFGYLDSVLERHSFDEFGELI